MSLQSNLLKEAFKLNDIKRSEIELLEAKLKQQAKVNLANARINKELFETLESIVKCVECYQNGVCSIHDTLIDETLSRLGGGA